MRGAARYWRVAKLEVTTSLTALGLAPPAAHRLPRPRLLGLTEPKRLKRAATITVAATLGLSIGAAAHLWPAPHGLVAVAFPPWVAAEEAALRIERAGGVPVAARPGRLWAMAIGPDQEFHRALRREGALLVVDGPALRRLMALAPG